MCADAVAQLAVRLAALEKSQKETTTATTTKLTELSDRVTHLEERLVRESEKCEPSQTDAVVVDKPQTTPQETEAVPCDIPASSVPKSVVDSISCLSEGLKALKTWTCKSKATLVFDSDKDGWDKPKFHEAMKKPSNAVIGITDKGDIFGGYVSVALTETGKWLPDDGQFAFSLFSHGRCDVPQRWMMKKDREGAGKDVAIWRPGNNDYITFGNFNCGSLKLNIQTNESWIGNPSRWFNGLGDTVLTGENHAFFTTTRLLVVRFE